MYFIAAKDTNDQYYIEEIQNDWHRSVDGFEPIDVVDGELVVFDDLGNKYFVGPFQKFSNKKLFWKMSITETGRWDFKKGEPYLINTKQDSSNELRMLLLKYIEIHKLNIDIDKNSSLEDIVLKVVLNKVKSDMPKAVKNAHDRSSGHPEDINDSKICGCFYCLKTFSPEKIEEWVDEGRTPMCPFCGIDAVLGDKSGYPITQEFLSEMNKHWFEGEGITLS